MAKKFTTYLIARPVFTGSANKSVVFIRFSLAHLSFIAAVCFEHGDVCEAHPVNPSSLPYADKYFQEDACISLESAVFSQSFICSSHHMTDPSVFAIDVCIVGSQRWDNLGIRAR
ncbi:hypothetical protein KIN20_019137 [Parelaphostrongylus tenuis]|uniref:Uncharacterized protein n=1 Tax=Parelaphostrongylus tenuis TaxID=148309 RepID=A0AAD5MKY3_PARTN|nr:hypothetical protein KIN20_019137 [Parelaphostrongylus tenuis]